MECTETKSVTNTVTARESGKRDTSQKEKAVETGLKELRQFVKKSNTQFEQLTMDR